MERTFESRLLPGRQYGERNLTRPYNQRRRPNVILDRQYLEQARVIKGPQPAAAHAKPIRRIFWQRRSLYSDEREWYVPPALEDARPCIRIRT